MVVSHLADSSATRILYAYFYLSQFFKHGTPKLNTIRIAHSSIIVDHLAELYFGKQQSLLPSHPLSLSLSLWKGLTDRVRSISLILEILAREKSGITIK